MLIKWQRVSVRYTRMLWVTLLVVVLAGCAMFSNSYIESSSPPGLGYIIKPAISGTSITKSIPTCTNDAACQRGWTAARKWVLQHCAPNLRVDTDREIRTVATAGSSGQLHCEIKRKSGPHGSAFYVRLNHASSSINYTRHDDLRQLMLDFNHTVNRAIRSEQ